MGKGAGDRAEAFQELARAHLGRLYGTARRLAGAEAEDLVQEALAKAYRAFGTLRKKEAGGKWLETILLNCFRDRLRRKAHQVTEVPLDGLDEFSLYRQIAEEDPFPYSDTLHRDFLGLFEPADVHRVLEALPEIYRSALVLRYVEGYPTRQIARLLGVPLGTALARLHRGRKLFERGVWDYAERNGLLEREVAG